MRSRFIDAWVTQQQREIRQSTRGIMAPEDRQALENEAESRMIIVERAAAARALTGAAEYYEGYLVEPELPMEDQPSPMARQYKSTAERLRKRAAETALGGGGR